MTDTENKEHLNEPRVVREEIKKIESEIVASLKVIRDRLSPEHLKEKALHKVICAVIARLARTGHFVRQRPVPTLLAGITLGWLALRKRKRRSVN